MSTCKLCLSTIKKNQLKINCSDCRSEFHAKCANISQADLDFIAEKGTVWRCEQCGLERRKSMRLESSAQEGTLTLDDIMKVLNEIKEEQKKNVIDFNTSYEALNTKIDESTNIIQIGMTRIEDYVAKIEDLQKENVTLKKKVTLLEARVEDMEQYSRRNCVELQGIPEDKNENVVEIVKSVGNALKMEITDSMIDTCHRVGKKIDAKPRVIIVKFVRRMDKEALVKMRREKRSDFSTRHLNMPSDLPVYINESLSPAKRRLLGQARQMKRDRSYKYLWLRNGVILMRKQEGSPVIEIKHLEDLSGL